VGALKRVHLRKVNVDTTVQEKAITYPTDAKLYHRMREKLVKEANALGLELRQTYTRKSQRSFLMQHRYRHARPMNRSRKELRKLKTYFGRVLRDLDRKTQGVERGERLKTLLALGYRLFEQKREDTNKLYSLPAPEVECIAKGKAHKKYEFGCKMSLVTSSKGNFILGALALHGSPYDGHTLSKALHQTHRLLPEGKTVEGIFADAGYPGHGITQIPVHLVKRGLKRFKPSLQKWLKRRAAMEPVIGHLKNDGGSKRNHLLGQEGDRMNAILLAYGFNLRKCLRTLSFYLDLLRSWMTQKDISLQQALPASR
jgi:IS5 family transposase